MLPGYLPADLRRQPFIRQPGIEIRPFQHTELTAVIKVPDPFEEHAFEELVDFYQTSLLRMCYLNLHDLGLAEDAVQETLMRCWVARHRLHHIEEMPAFAMRILKNLCIEQLRGKKEVSDYVTDDHTAPADIIMMHREQHEWMMTCLRQLPALSYR